MIALFGFSVVLLNVFSTYVSSKVKSGGKGERDAEGGGTGGSVVAGAVVEGQLAAAP